MADALLGRLFGVPEVQAHFEGLARLQGMLDFEAALARVEAQLGLVPEAAAAQIAVCCDAGAYDLEALGKEAVLSGNTAIPMVKALRAAVARQDPTAEAWVHLGATSQDAQDTGLMLQLRPALDWMSAELTRLMDAAAVLAQRHRDTPLPGRTWMQHALPVTFGLKAAGWLDALQRHAMRLQETRQRVLALQFGGAAGTLASLHPHGMAVARALAQALGLAFPALPWHSHRDRIAELGSTLALLVGTLGKMARDLSLHMQTDVAEAFEPDAPGRGGSSSMPQKRNPVSCAVVLSAAARAPGLAGTLLSAMPQELERGLGGWHAEWVVLPDLFNLSAGALQHMRQVIEGLEVDAERMRTNLEATHGQILAETVKTALVPHLGAAEAHALVETACRNAARKHLHLRDLLQSNERVSAVLSAEELAHYFDPANYLGACGDMVDAVLAAHRKGR